MSATPVARVIHDPRDSSKDEYLTIATARNLYHLGQLELDETNSKPDAPVYIACHEAEKHPQWAAWKAWYTKHHGAYIPMALGQPSTFPTLVSWQSWCASWAATKPKWRAFADEKPVLGADGMIEILWRVPIDPTKGSDVPDGYTHEVGIGWYHEEDAAEWTGEWLPVLDLQ